MSVIVHFGQGTVRFVNIYWRPNLNVSNFINDFEALILELESMNIDFILLGDFNIWFDKKDDGLTKQYVDVLANHSLIQLVNSCTRCIQNSCQLGHTLDHVMQNRESFD